jgi:hypothetical protein
MRNISFSMTEPQFLARSKTVTRRLGWEYLRPGDRLMGCRKCMGRKPGEPLVRLGAIQVVAVNRELLGRLVSSPAYGRREVIAEGFPDMTPAEFVAFFIAAHRGTAARTIVTRIRFEYLSIAPEFLGEPTQLELAAQ